MAELLSVNVGLPQDVDWHGKTVHTAVWKHSVAGKRRVRHLNIDGDKQGDLIGHGGEQRAVLVYQIESYQFWESELHRNDFNYGQFGENLTIAGFPDDKACIGDRYGIGSAVFDVTQPRVTCYRVGIRMGEPRMAALPVAHHRPGFYMRVIREGEIEAGNPIVKAADGPEQLTVREADALLYLPDRNPARLERALRIDAVSPGWMVAFRNNQYEALPALRSAAMAWSRSTPTRIRCVICSCRRCRKYAMVASGCPRLLAWESSLILTRFETTPSSRRPGEMRHLPRFVAHGQVERRLHTGAKG